MAYEAKTYTLKEAAEGGTRYSISFKDGQGNITNWKYQNSYSLNFGRWSAGTVMSMILISARLARWSIAPLPLFRNSFQSQGKRSRQK